MTMCRFTVNPQRRIRQHNGEITSGAVRTKRCAVRVMHAVHHLVSIASAAALTPLFAQVPALGHGTRGLRLPNTGLFLTSCRGQHLQQQLGLARRTSPQAVGPTQVQALQFEWAWQHPDKSKALREAYAGIRKTDLKGARGKVHCFV